MITVWRGDPNYEATRRRMVWNDRIPGGFPDVIVSVTSDADVIEAVKLARSRGVRIAVGAGGHSWIGRPPGNILRSHWSGGIVT